MKIGKLLKERMKLLNISFEDLENLTYINSDILNQLLDNEIDFEELDDYDKEILSNALFCSKDYFINENARKYDMVISSLNRGYMQNEIAIRTKCKLQRLINDFVYIDEIKSGENNGK